MRRLISLALLACSLLCAADISGTWEFTVETSQGSGNPTFTFKQEGEKLSGTYSGLFGKADLSGTVKGDTVEFSFDVSGGGQSAKMLYKGTIESATKMKGEAALGEVGKATWTAAKK